VLLILERLKPIIEENHLLTAHQFGFRKKNHSKIDRVHRIAEIIDKMLEYKGVRFAVFLTISQASYRE
jgi:hypothetical protein